MGREFAARRFKKEKYHLICLEQLRTFPENNLCNLAFAETIFHIRSSCLCGRFGKWIHFLVIWLPFITQSPGF